MYKIEKKSHIDEWRGVESSDVRKISELLFPEIIRWLPSPMMVKLFWSSEKLFDGYHVGGDPQSQSLPQAQSL